MNYLIGDIGNTNIKICKVNKKFKIINTYFFDTRNPSLEKKINKKLKHIIYDISYKKILISSVVPKAFKRISKIFIKKKFNVFEIKQFNLNKILKIRIKKYSELGSDRIANAIGSYYKYKSNCIVIDFGTATTFDVIKRHAIYFVSIVNYSF